MKLVKSGVVPGVCNDCKTFQDVYELYDGTKVCKSCLERRFGNGPESVL